MKFVITLTVLALVATVLSLLLVDNSYCANGFNDECVNATTITHGFTKRQNPQALALIMSAIGDIADQLSQEEITRAQFTKDLVSVLWFNNSNYNYIICHVDHDYSFQGGQGVDWDHREIALVDLTTASFISFDVVVGGAGKFVRHGDGGFINWAYIGYVASKTDVGSDSTVVFNAP